MKRIEIDNFLLFSHLKETINGKDNFEKFSLLMQSIDGTEDDNSNNDNIQPSRFTSLACNHDNDDDSNNKVDKDDQEYDCLRYIFSNRLFSYTLTKQ